jgi:AraC family transcriptional activator of pobA
MADGTPKSSGSRTVPAVSGAARRALNVPAYYLYGENWTAESFGFFHIEPFAVRNIPNNWRIGLHRHPDFHQLSITFAGRCAFEHDGYAATEAEPCCVFTPANVVHQFTYEPGSVGYVISVSSDFVAGLTLDNGPVKSALARLSALRLIKLRDDATAERLRKLISLVAETFTADYGRSRETVRHLFGAFLLELNGMVASAAPIDHHTARSTAGTADLFNRFRECLETELELTGRSGRPPDTAHTVESFAARLSTTTYALNAACKRALGRSAKDIVQTALLGQATRLLLYTQRSIKEIAYGLGYSHPSHFVRFFKHHRGVTPEIFRQRFIELEPGSAI